MPSVRFGNEPYQYETEASAGISLGDGEKRWGTRVRFRRGTGGRWTKINVIGLHPFDAPEDVEDALLQYLRSTERTRG